MISFELDFDMDLEPDSDLRDLVVEISESVSMDVSLSLAELTLLTLPSMAPKG